MNRLACAIVLGMVGSFVVEASGPESRLVAERPTQGRFVATDHGFMVPYTQRIPGSGVEIEMVPIPGGTIELGPLPPLAESTDQAPSEDSTRAEPTTPTQENNKQVAVSPFWMGKLEITMGQYMPYRQLYYAHKKAEADANRQQLELDDVDGVSAPTDVYEYKYNFEYAGEPNSPVPTTSQFAARQYTKWLSLLTELDYRLPLRSEWQHACQSGTPGPYGVGKETNRLDEFAVTWNNTPASFQILTGTKQPNAWGLHDMHGNFSEWVIEDTAMQGLFRGHVAMGGNFGSQLDACRCDSMLRSSDEWWDEDPELPTSPWWATSEESRMNGFRIISPLSPMTLEEKNLYWNPDSEQLRLDVRDSVESGRGTFGFAK